ncbi:hypothetical protein PFISCL1PPCAC_2610 [Pristionchus fissidentatus]|uniref:EF-hand domain-containing protein n=1 Tax=Pristionchus fissidentatus TaxID=1538716 RepID=A0AAV5UX43_9BILA|nr:hypothetical protein PFISCL1PPCAC_2610 [Pristionchus fissidentatus]
MDKKSSEVDRVRDTFRTISGGRECVPLMKIRKELMERQDELDIDELRIRSFLKKSDTDADRFIDLEEFEIIMAKGLGKTNRIRKALICIANTVIAKKQRLQMTSYLDRYTFWPPPIFIILISLAQVCAFCLYYSTDSRQTNLFFACPGCFGDDMQKPGSLIFAPIKSRSEWWRFLTYQFINQGFLYFIVKVLLQMVIGIPLEIVHKCWRIALIYVLAIVSGSTLQYSIDPSVYLIGNTAGLYALIFTHLSNIVLNWESMPFRRIRIAAILIFIVVETASIHFSHAIFGECTMVTHSAQLAGLITGLFFGLSILYPLVREDCHVVARAVAATFYAFFLVELLIFTVIRDPLPPNLSCWNSTIDRN